LGSLHACRVQHVLIAVLCSRAAMHVCQCIVTPGYAGENARQQDSNPLCHCMFCRLNSVSFLITDHEPNIVSYNSHYLSSQRRMSRIHLRILPQTIENRIWVFGSTDRSCSGIYPGEHPRGAASPPRMLINSSRMDFTFRTPEDHLALSVLRASLHLTAGSYDHGRLQHPGKQAQANAHDQDCP